MRIATPAFVQKLASRLPAPIAAKKKTFISDNSAMWVRGRKVWPFLICFNSYYRFTSYRGQVVPATLRHAQVLCACAIVTAIPYTSPSQKWFSDLLYNLCRLSDEGGPVGQSVRKFVGPMSPFLGIDICLLAGAFNNQSLQEGAQRHLGRLAFTFRCWSVGFNQQQHNKPLVLCLELG